MTTFDGVDLSDMAFWLRPESERHAVFAELRRDNPVPFFGEVLPPGFQELYPDAEPGPGYWSLTKYDDVVFASRHPELFCSRKGINIGDLPPDLIELLGSMVNMDAPRHTKFRLLVNKGFTPRMVARIESYVHEIARECVDAIASNGSCDFVTEVAAPMPLRVICDMLGIPREDNAFILEQTNHLLGGLDPEYNTRVEDVVTGGWNLWNYAQELGAARLRDPRDDITTALMHAEVDGERLTAGEFGSFFVLLCSAGNETTRNAISHGLRLFSAHPVQRKLVLDDPDAYLAPAAEEIVRYASPVMHFRRTATQDVTLPSGRASFKEGDKVVLWFWSANRDEDVFDRPDEFDITRTPNEHVGFGAGGPHFCLGASLARREVRVLFEELFRVLPDIEATAEPDYLESNFINGIKHLEAGFTTR